MFIANAVLSFARFSYTRALESLTAVVPRLDRGSASFRPRLRLVSPGFNRGSYEALPRSKRKRNIPCL